LAILAKEENGRQGDRKSRKRNSFDAEQAPEPQRQRDRGRNYYECEGGLSTDSAKTI
jgi:hypothetical protein